MVITYLFWKKYPSIPVCILSVSGKTTPFTQSESVATGEP
jgi:hypothetical protein